MKNKKIGVYAFLGMFFVILSVILLGFHFISNRNNLKAGKVIISNYTSSISLSENLPVTEDIDESTNEIIITFKGETRNSPVEYLIKMSNENFDFSDTLPFDLSFTVEGLGNQEIDYFQIREKQSSIYKVLFEKEYNNDEQLMIGVIPSNTSNINGTIKIKASLNSDGNIDNLKASFKIKVEAKEGLWIEENAASTIKRKISDENKNIIKEINASKFGGDGEIIYFQGNEDVINNNYVWYSGKLWRIVAIYPNGIMKMITENPMTAIDFGNNSLFSESYVNQWLLDEFLPTLSNHDKIVLNNPLWNITPTDVDTNPYAKDKMMIVRKTVGLLNAYEYKKTINESGSYLNIGQFWWLSDAYNDTYVRSINSDGLLIGSMPNATALAVRPAIYLRRKVFFVNQDDSLAGTRNNPYRISDDSELGKDGELINNRQIGEFILLNDQKYRIVGFEASGVDRITKIISTEYVENVNSSNNNKILSSYGEDKSFGTISSNLTYWDNYLKNEWIADKSLLSDGKYYLGSYVDGDYRQAICEVEENFAKSIEECTKIDDEELIYNGAVGLLRVGEMFSAQQSFMEHTSSASVYQPMWLITPYLKDSTSIRRINNNGILDSTSIIGNFNAVRPTLYLKANVKIHSGKGMINDPYILYGEE